jgi:hypothetical protein
MPQPLAGMNTITNVLQVTGLDFAREQLDIATQRQLESVTASSIDMQ